MLYLFLFLAVIVIAILKLESVEWYFCLQQVHACVR